MARGRQVQGHCDVEGQCEDREVPLAEDGTQGTRKDRAGDGRDKGLIAALILQPILSSQLWSLDHSPSPLLGTAIPGSLET